jgi:peptide/nickel transport system ATP-binding protein
VTRVVTTQNRTRQEHLAVRGLSVRLRVPRGAVAAVIDVSFGLRLGECLALVGESGCGKSVLVSALLGLLPGNAETRGTAVLDGDPPVELLSAPERVLAGQVRGRRAGLVPQSPGSHLTPVHTGRTQLEEALRVVGPARADVRVGGESIARRVGLPLPALDLYPHELSGGMAQRMVTAVALAGDPWLLLADEPTTGLDHPLVERTLDELRRLGDAGHAVLLITHDLAAARRIADRVAVMYAGRIVEIGPTPDVFASPRHQYTRALLDALPERGFHAIPGQPPELTALPPGCGFSSRCPRADDACAALPALDGPDGHAWACHHPC